MKINKKSWHYRLIRWRIEWDFHFPPTREEVDCEMPQTLCSYLSKLLSTFVEIFFNIFLVIFFLAFIAMVIWTHPHEAKYFLLALPVICVSGVIVWIVYNLITDFIRKPIQKWQSNHCPKIDYK
jgi:magnesium-transporting ATPase (P-type)